MFNDKLVGPTQCVQNNNRYIAQIAEMKSLLGKTRAKLGFIISESIEPEVCKQHVSELDYELDSLCNLIIKLNSDIRT